MKRIAPEAQIIDITHGIPADRRSCRARSCSRTRSASCRSASISRSSTRASAGRGARSRFATPRAASTSGRTTACCCRRRAAPASRRRTSSRIPTYALESISRTFHGRDLFAPAAAHLATGVPLAELGPPVDPEGLVRLDLPEPVDRRRGDPRDAAVRRQLREHRAQPRPRRRRGARDRLRDARRARARRRALLRGHGADVRGRTAGRRDPLRGQLQEHVARDLSRKRGAHAACLARAGDPHHDRATEAATRPADAGPPMAAPPRSALRG